MGVCSLAFALQEIGYGDFSVPGMRDDAHGGLRCRSLKCEIQPCTSPLRSITNFDAQDYKFGCVAVRISLTVAPVRGLSTGRRGPASSALRKRMSHNRRKPQRPAVLQPRLLTRC